MVLNWKIESYDLKAQIGLASVEIISVLFVTPGQLYSPVEYQKQSRPVTLLVLDVYLTNESIASNYIPTKRRLVGTRIEKEAPALLKRETTL